MTVLDQSIWIEERPVEDGASLPSADVTTITPGFIRTRLAYNALKGDGSAFDREDGNISAGMDAETCAKIARYLRRANSARRWRARVGIDQPDSVTG